MNSDISLVGKKRRFSFSSPKPRLRNFAFSCRVELLALKKVRGYSEQKYNVIFGEIYELESKKIIGIVKNRCEAQAINFERVLKMTISKILQKSTSQPPESFFGLRRDNCWKNHSVYSLNGEAGLT